MILVDTSAWIDYLNGKDSPHTELLDTSLIDGTVAIADLIFLEILQGFKSEKDYKLVKSRLSTLEQYSIFNSSMVEPCANNFRFLRKKGIRVRKTNDVIIASYCIQRKIPLLYTDRDFDPFVKYLNLYSVADR